MLLSMGLGFRWPCFRQMVSLLISPCKFHMLGLIDHISTPGICVGDAVQFANMICGVCRKAMRREPNRNDTKQDRF